MLLVGAWFGSPVSAGNPTDMSEMSTESRLEAAPTITKDAVQCYGNPDLHRMYIIAHAGHVDLHADGGWGVNSAEIDMDIHDLLTSMQAYAMRTLNYLEDWVENGNLPPDSKLVETDPAIDITDPNLLSW